MSSIKKQIFSSQKLSFIKSILYNSLNNSLISDANGNNISRNNNVVVTAHDSVNKYIDVNINVHEMMRDVSSNSPTFPWFIVQEYQASIIVEVSGFDTANSNRLYYGTSYGNPYDFSIGEKLELLNSFVSYEFLKEDGLLIPNPSVLDGKLVDYLMTGGVFQHSNGTYVLICTAIFTNGDQNIFRATSTDLVNWNLESTPIFTGISITNFSGNPYFLDNGNLLFLYTGKTQTAPIVNNGGFIIFDEDMNMVGVPGGISMEIYDGSGSHDWVAMDVTHFDGKFRFFLHDRKDGVDLNEQAIEYTYSAAKTDANLMNFLYGNVIPFKNIVFDAAQGSGYLYGKTDDIAYYNDGNSLNIIIGSEQEPSSSNGEWAIDQNREYGIATLNNGSWQNDPRSPTIVNPIQYSKKYPSLKWAWDHFGRSVCHIEKDGYLYIFLSIGGIQHYGITGLKFQLKP